MTIDILWNVANVTTLCDRLKKNDIWALNKKKLPLVTDCMSEHTGSKLSTYVRTEQKAREWISSLLTQWPCSPGPPLRVVWLVSRGGPRHRLWCWGWSRWVNGENAVSSHKAETVAGTWHFQCWQAGLFVHSNEHSDSINERTESIIIIISKGSAALNSSPH